ncbi:MAG: hypothetical protein KGZ83_01690 [Sulfuricella sp.]|nr:hypothetical protein [Sulfuricella sp.]
MARLYLDYQRGKPFPWGGTALLVVALAAAILLAGYQRGLSHQAAGLEAHLEGVERPFKRLATSGEQGKDLEQEVSQANEVLRQLTLPWDKLFDSVESSSDKDVALLAMEPDIAKRTVKISGEARNILAMLGYVTRLEEQDIFGTVYLQNHQVQLNVPEKPVQFTVLAAWKEMP